MPTLTEQPGFSPDSAYASWGTADRESSDRIEAYFNQQHRVNSTLGDAARGHTVHGMTDDSLRNLTKRYTRQIEDIEDRTMRVTKPRRGIDPIGALNLKLRDIEREQGYRSALAESWLASEDGTHCYSSFQGRGGLEAVLHHGATPASYYLAAILDWENWKRGLPCVLDWKA